MLDRLGPVQEGFGEILRLNLKEVAGRTQAALA